MDHPGSQQAPAGNTGCGIHRFAQCFQRLQHVYPAGVAGRRRGSTQEYTIPQQGSVQRHSLFQSAKQSLIHLPNSHPGERNDIIQLPWAYQHIRAPMIYTVHYLTSQRRTVSAHQKMCNVLITLYFYLSDKTTYGNTKLCIGVKMFGASNEHLPNVTLRPDDKNTI